MIAIIICYIALAEFSCPPAEGEPDVRLTLNFSEMIFSLLNICVCFCAQVFRRRKHAEEGRKRGRERRKMEQQARQRAEQAIKDMVGLME